MKKFLAVDIGGTFLQSGVVDEKGCLSFFNQVRTPISLEKLIDALYHLYQQHQNVCGISISCPGSVSESGIIYGTTALPYIHGPNVKQMIQERLDIPVFIENDGNCAGYAEIWKGNVLKDKDVVVIVIGTGVGGALIKNGMVHRGSHLYGGEFGYMLIPTDTGYQTLSDSGATGAIVREVNRLKTSGADNLTGEIIFEMAEAGDRICQNAIDKFYKSLAIGIYNLQYIFDPAIVLIGGGISARSDLINHINIKLSQIMKDLPDSAVKPNIEFCQFRNHGNLLGAVFGHMRELSLNERKITSNGVDAT